LIGAKMDTGDRLMTDDEIYQTREIRTAIAELDAGQGVSHEEITQWLNSWGTAGETKAPR
jgi:predicted transcriptional regulator